MEIHVFLGYRGGYVEASWDTNWKDEVKIAKVKAKLGERRQDRSKRPEEEAYCDTILASKIQSNIREIF